MSMYVFEGVCSKTYVLISVTVFCLIAEEDCQETDQNCKLKYYCKFKLTEYSKPCLWFLLSSHSKPLYNQTFI